ncbi:hypothetical protein D3C77_412210 [compost metagenome]
MKCVTMTESGGVKTFAVVIDYSRTINNLVLAVIIDISYTQTMIPLTCVGAIARRVGIKSP